MLKKGRIRFETCLIMVLFFFPSAVNAQCKSNQTSPLAVVLSTAKARFRVGEPISVKVEIHNCGNEPLFIGNTLPTYSWTYSLNLHIKDENGLISPEFGPATPFMTGDPKQTFIDAATSDWIALQPGHFYGTYIRITRSDFEFLGKPGRFQLVGRYESDGMESPVRFNRLAENPEEIRRLPYKSWVGQVATNSLWLEVVPGPK